MAMKDNKISNEAGSTKTNSPIFKVKLNKICYHGVLNTHYYKLPVIKSLKNIQEMFLMGYTTYFRKKIIFNFFPKNQPIYHLKLHKIYFE